jgi:A/G-specific adenine glycosylase
MFDDEAALLAGAGPAVPEVMPRIEHALTHFDWVLHTRRVQNPVDATALPEGEWVAREELARYALPAPLKKLINP